jgi:hypothetical protein
MSLIVTMRNISNLADVSDYYVTVWVNDRQISKPIIVKGHRRSDGWEALVKRYAKGLKVKKFRG